MARLRWRDRKGVGWNAKRFSLRKRNSRNLLRSQLAWSGKFAARTTTSPESRIASSDNERERHEQN